VQILHMATATTVDVRASGKGKHYQAAMDKWKTASKVNHKGVKAISPPWPTQTPHVENPEFDEK
jgi:hypothetical protein